ncbi:MAG: alpha/beta hydrolase, partial [Chlamydiia bacterium]|nr:alpha/beta hydrolase [Chlamydiia bacterium]
KKKVRFYIGNHDMRVGTDHAFSFIQNLAKEAHTHRIRTSPIELIIGPSIGYQGHGTAPQTFQSGAEWVKGALL